MGTSGTLGTETSSPGTETSSSGTETSSPGTETSSLGTWFSFHPPRVCTSPRGTGPTPPFAGVGFRTGSFGLLGGRVTGRRRVTTAPRGRSARVSREAIGAYPRTHSSSGASGRSARAGGTRGRDPRAVSSTPRRAATAAGCLRDAPARAKRDVLSRSARSCASTVARSERGRRACAGGVTEGRGVGAGVSADGSRRGERFSEASAREKNVGEAETPRRARARTRASGGDGAGGMRVATRRNDREASRRTRWRLRERRAVAPRSGDVRREAERTAYTTRRARIAGIEAIFASIPANSNKRASSHVPHRTGYLGAGTPRRARPKAPGAAARSPRAERRDAVRDDLETARALWPGRRGGGAPPTAGRDRVKPFLARERTNRLVSCATIASLTRRPRVPTRLPQARRGYASGFRSGRKEPPPPLVHSAKSSAPESTAKPEAPPPHPPPPPPPPPPPNPPAASPSASPEPAGGGPSLTAPLVLTAGVGLAAYYFSRDADDAAAREGAPRSSPRDRTGDRTAHRTAGSTPDAARATASQSNTTDVPFESESTSTSKHEASRGAGNDATGDEVFRSAADSILAAARAAAEAADEAAEAEARRARKREEKEKGREKERRDRMERDSRRAAKRDPPADLAGPAGAARARALADADGDVRVQGGDALSPAALVTRAFEGAVEVRARIGPNRPRRPRRL